MSNRNASLAERLRDDPESILFVAFDTETTGMWAASNQVVEIGAVKCTATGTIVSEHQSLVHPGRAIPAEVIPIHGITDEMVQDAPPMSLVLPQFLDFAGDADFLIAHNAPFDLAFLNWEAKRINLPLPELLVLDSCALARLLLPGQLSYSLENLSLSLGFIDAKQSHRALDDARLVSLLTLKLLGVIEQAPPERMRKLLRGVSLNTPEEVVVLPVHLDELVAAVEEKRTLWISYESDTVPPHSRLVLPRFLFSNRGKQYLTAFCFWTRSERTFRLDRVSALVLPGEGLIVQIPPY